MRVYIASKYIEHKTINNTIYKELQKASIEAFLPESINITALTDAEKYYVAEICYNEIERCDVFLAVCPFGQSVSAEFGYAVALKRKFSQKKRFIALNLDFENEVMLYPYVDKTVGSVDQLVEYLTKLRS